MSKLKISKATILWATRSPSNATISNSVCSKSAAFCHHSTTAGVTSVGSESAAFSPEETPGSPGVLDERDGITWSRSFCSATAPTMRHQPLQRPMLITGGYVLGCAYCQLVYVANY